MFRWIFLILLMCSSLCWSQVIICLGDSLTEGYGVEPEEAYPHLLQTKLFDVGKKTAKVINAGVSGSTSSSGLERLNWVMKAGGTHLLLALGANDGLRGLPLSETKKQLEKIIEAAQTHQLKVLLLGMKLPTNYGKEYRKQFENMYENLAKKYRLPKPPFLLEGVAAKKELNQADGIHPNPKGHQIMAQLVYDFLKAHL
jgi:acyl-CoA thioesterase I